MSRPDRTRFGYLIGSDQNEKLVLPNRKDKIDVVGATDLHDLRPRETNDFDLLHITKSYFRQPVRYELEPYNCLLNCVTDPDSNPKVLANIAKLVKGYRGRVINRPKAVERSSRDRVATTLAGIDNLIVPATFRIAKGRGAMVRRLDQRGALKYPVIVREAGTHSGDILGLCNDLSEIERVLAPRSDCILTEFVDYRSADAIFRKFRVFVIGEELVFRHIVYSEQWNAHAKDREIFMRKHPDKMAEWQGWCEDGLARFSDETIAVLHQIRQRLGLDFFGIDFGLHPDGRVILFEANATMSFFPFPADPALAFASNPLPPARRAFDRLMGLSG